MTRRASLGQALFAWGLLAWRTGCPVKVLYDRREEFANLSPRQSASTRIVQGCDAEGRLTFRRVEVTQDNGAYTS